MSNNFSVGEKVSIKSENNNLMKKVYSNQSARIKASYDGYYRLDIDNRFYAWHDDELIPYNGF